MGTVQLRLLVHTMQPQKMSNMVCEIVVFNGNITVFVSVILIVGDCVKISSYFNPAPLSETTKLKL